MIPDRGKKIKPKDKLYTPYIILVAMFLLFIFASSMNKPIFSCTVTDSTPTNSNILACKCVLKLFYSYFIIYMGNFMGSQRMPQTYLFSRSRKQTWWWELPSLLSIRDTSHAWASVQYAEKGN